MSFQSARKNAGLRVSAAAKALNVTDSAIHQWEYGITVPDARKLLGVARLYDCTVEELLVGNPEPKGREKNDG